MSMTMDAQTALVDAAARQGVVSEPVLEALGKIDRREFVSKTFASRAYDDMALPIALGQTISQPTMVGLMTQALKADKLSRVLEIGTGSGYQTMILSHLCRHVYSVERYRSLADSARRLVVERHKRQNVSIIHADGTRGLPDAAPFDRILLTAAPEDVPPCLLGQLKDDGIMVLPVGRSVSEQYLLQVIRRPGAEDEYNDLGGVRFVPLLEGIENE